MTHQPSDGVVCCSVAGEQFAMHGADVRLVARAEQMIEEPALWDGRVGVLDQAGTITPVYRLATLLGLPTEPARAGDHIVVTSGARGPFGVLVDRAVRAAPGDRLDVLPLPAFAGSAAARWFAGILHGGSVSCLLLSPEGVEPGASTPSPPRGVVPRPPAHVRRGSGAADVVVVFSSMALPPCDANRYAIGARRIVGVVQALPSVSLPGAAPFVAAVSWWEGAAVPLLDFSGRRAGADHSRYLLVRTRGGEYAGLPVGADVALRRATKEHRQLAGGSAAYVEGLFAVGDEHIALIDVDALVAADERALVASCAG